MGRSWLALVALLWCGATGAFEALDAKQLEGRFDALVPAVLHDNAVAGGAIVVVQAGQVVFAKGYGLADTTRRQPVSARDTMFRLGSVSKLLTWQAVMQLVEAGKIDLDRDVNDYLDFAVSGLGGRPITLRQLMTHTAGFEDRYQGLWAADARQAAQLRDYLTKSMPTPIFAPGIVPAYSNYGAALAGYIVERVSGEPFADYIEHHITGPLGMRHTTMRQPVPAGLAPYLSQVFQHAGGTARPFEFIRAPAGGATASAADMGRFMLTQLNGGSLDGTRILSPPMTARMLAVQPGRPDGANAMALGWLSVTENGPRTLGHDGATLYSRSLLNLYLDHDAGLFVALNSAADLNGDALGRIVQVLEHSLAAAQERRVSPVSSARCPGEAGGPFLPSRRNETGMGYGVALALQIRLSCENGRLRASGPGLADGPWQAIAPLTWQASDGSRLRLNLGADGTWEASTGNPANVYRQGRWHQDARFAAAIAGCALLALALAALNGLWRVVRRRSLGALPHGGAIAWAVGALGAAGGGLVAALAAQPERALGPGFDIGLATLQAAGWLGVVGLLWSARRCAQFSRWDWLGWSGAALVALLAIDLNLLAFGPRY